jgi:hypothetical protein
VNGYLHKIGSFIKKVYKSFRYEKRPKRVLSDLKWYVQRKGIVPETLHLREKLELSPKPILVDMDLSQPRSKSEYEIFKHARLHLYKRDFQNAAKGFAELIQSYPQSLYVDDALYWKLECDRNLGNFEEIVRTVPVLISQNQEWSRTNYKSPIYTYCRIKGDWIANLLDESHIQFESLPFILSVFEDGVRRVSPIITKIKKGDEHKIIFTFPTQFFEKFELYDENIKKLAKIGVQIGIKHQEITPEISQVVLNLKVIEQKLPKKLRKMLRKLIPSAFLKTRKKSACGKAIFIPEE